MSAPSAADFDEGSPVAIDQAAHRAALFGVTATARFIVGDLTSTGIPDAHAEARRILRPAGQLVLTNWQPKVPDDARLSARLRIDWPRLLRGAGFGPHAPGRCDRARLAQ